MTINNSELWNVGQDLYSYKQLFNTVFQITLTDQ